MDTFKHSGFATRKGQVIKQLESNSVARPYRNVGFGNTESRESNKKKRDPVFSGTGDIDTLMRDNPTMDAKKLGELCVKAACRQHFRAIMPYISPTEDSQVAEKPAFTLNRQASFQVYTSGPVLSRQTSNIGNAQNTPMASRPTTAMPIDDKRISSGRPQFIEPTISADHSERPRVIRPSSSAPAFKRKQMARRGHEPFKYEVPPESMVEIRCMLHPNIKRDWNYNIDSWFPGMMTRTKEIIDNNHTGHTEERRTKPKQYFQTKQFLYNEEDVEEARSKPIVRCASAYIDPDRATRQAQLEKDTRIICKRKIYDRVLKKEKVINVPFYTLFKSSFKENTKENDQEKDAVTISTSPEYRPVSSHKFRDKNKNQWIARSDFKLF